MSQGFWVKNLQNELEGPFERLNEARSHARKISPNVKLNIYHGTKDDNYLVPKP